MSDSRIKLLVDKQVQGALARRIVFHWCVFFVLCLLCLFTLEYFLGDPTLTFGGHMQVLWQKYAFFVLLMLCVVPSFVYDSLKLSNRFAGPMVRLRDSLRSLADGEQVAELKFRDGDFWKDVSSEFNRIVRRAKTSS